MCSDVNNSTSDPAPLRGKEERGRVARWYAHLDATPAFRPVIIALSAIFAGLLIAPQLTMQSFPADTKLLGTPANANYKAPRDLDVIDEEATRELREAAAASTRRVFDFDTELGEKLRQNIVDSFALVRPSIEAYQSEHPEITTSRRLPKSQELRLREELRERVAAVQPRFERALGVTLRPEENEALIGVRYDPELAAALGKVVRTALTRPIIEDPSVFDPDRDKGITIKRVPSDGLAPEAVADTRSIATLDAVRQGFATHVTEVMPDLPPAWRDFITAVGARLLQPSLTPSRTATETARDEARGDVEPVRITAKKGEMIIRDGERLTRRHLLLFAEIEGSDGRTPVVLAAIGTSLAVLLIIALGWGWIPHRERRFIFSSRDILFLAVLFLAGIGTARLWAVIATALHDKFPVWPTDALLFTLPFAAGAMITRLVLRANIAVWFAILSSLVLSLTMDTEHGFILFAVVGSIIGATRIRAITARADLLRVGVVVGAGQAAAALVIQLFSGQASLTPYLIALPLAFAGGILSGLATLALTSVVETLFGYTTDLKLLELANLNHPALKDLIVQAPGSYHHSVIVGALVENAAEAIGANPLLARVMAYYHDIGKGCNPQYFIENQRAGQNPHDKLKPSMSAMVIKRHVSDGLELARRYRLGEPIRAAIAEHHGTTLIHYFHRKAKEQAEDPDSVFENDYRYPGSKPQSREAALVMLGDSVEAAARSVADPSPARLAGVVARIINLKFTDEQLEECDITLKDLHSIAKSFSTVLASIYHTRPEYPELLKELANTKKQNGDPDPKTPRRPRDIDNPDEEPRPENLRRLGLS